MIREWLRAAGAWLTLRFSGGEEPSVDRVIHTYMHSLATVDRGRALSVPSLIKGRNVICSVATLPLVQRDASNVVQTTELLTQIDPDVANVVTLAQTLEDLLFDAIAWWVVLERDALGFPTKARHVAPGQVSLQPPAGYNPAPLPSGEDPRGAAVWVDGVRTPARDVVRFDSPNPALLRVGADIVRRAVAIDAAARLYSDNPVPLDYFTPNTDADPADDDTVAQILADWRNARRRRTTAYVPAALTYNTVDVISPRDLQLVELQRQAALDMANMIGLDPEDVGVSTTSRTYQNATDRRQDRINDTLAPYMRAITDRLSMGDVTPPGQRVEFELSGYLRADPKTRSEVYTAGLDKWWDAEDIQRMEGIPVKEIKRPEPPAAPGALPDNVRELRPRALAADADGDPRWVAFDAADPQHVEFAGSGGMAVDWENRTVSGIVMPYWRTSSVIKNGRRWQFKPGALKFGDVARVKLLRDHDFAQAEGRMLEAVERPEGMWARFRVARGPAGDRVLAEAEDGVRDAFSCGVVIREAVPHPTETGTYVVTDAHWQETSILAVPAFDDARLAADGTSQGEAMQTCSTCGADLTPGVAHTCQGQIQPAVNPTPAEVVPAAAPGQLTVAQFGALWEQWRAENPGPTLVNPHRAPAVQVTEPAPYRFDGNGDMRMGTHDFSTDAFLSFGQGSEAQAARDRVNGFLETAFDVVTTNVNELNMPPNRPNMYVDQREYQFPVWNAVNKGTLANVTPFTFPKWSSDSGLVGAHTEGVEPSSGTFVVTNDTVTPTAISGKIKISRETIDQGGNPQISQLIWRQMTRRYFESLEAAAVALLDAATPTAIALTAGAADAALAEEFEQKLALLHFIRGGFSMTAGFAQVDLYKALTAARDSAGRPLYPIIGAQNANGEVSQRFGSVNVGGTLLHPTWALAASGSVVASSYLFDPDSVWMWASNPRRLDFEYEVANLYMGIWGYKAGVITDITGVREITYDPVA